MEGPRCICLTSDANGDVFPDNHHGHFANVFPYAVIRDASRRYTLRLRYVAVNHAVLASRNNVSRVVVNIWEVEPQRDGRKYTQRIGTFPVPAPNRTPYYQLDTEVTSRQAIQYATHTFREAPRLLLRRQHLAQLRVVLTDEHGAELSGSLGHPTLVMLEVESEDDAGERGQFTITCRSDGDGLHPTNTLSDFVSPLPTPMELRDYEVALQHVAFPPLLLEDTGDITVTVNNWSVEYNIQDFRTTDTFIRTVNRDLRDKFSGELTLSRGIHGVTGAPAGPVTLRRSLRRAPVEGHAGPRILAVSFSEGFLLVVAGTQGNTIEDGTIVRPGEELAFGGSPDIHRVAPYSVAMLECDIVAHNIVAGRQAQLLQVVPVYHKRESGEERLYEPAELIFQPVEERPISQIRLRFAHPDGTRRKFLTYEFRTKPMMLITLVFRKRQ